MREPPTVLQSDFRGGSDCLMGNVSHGNRVRPSGQAERSDRPLRMSAPVTWPEDHDGSGRMKSSSNLQGYHVKEGLALHSHERRLHRQTVA